MVAAMGAGGGLTFAAFDPSAAQTDAELDPDIALALKKLNKNVINRFLANYSIIHLDYA